MKRTRADEGDDWYGPTIIGIGSAHNVREQDPDDPPGIWLPEHRSGSRMGGWRLQPVTPHARPIGFRRPNA